MVHYCCAHGCKEKASKDSPVTFHSFPKDPLKRKMWEVMIKRLNFKATDSSKICSKHFTPDSFDTTKFGGTWLKSDAVPSIFDFGENSKGETKLPIPRKPPMKRGMSPDENSHEEASFKMPNVCSAYGCSNTSIKASCKEKRISFHQMPFDDKNRLKLWLVKMRRENFNPSINTMICSEHFTVADFKYQPFTNRRGLKKTAVPTKFYFTATDSHKMPRTSDESESRIVQHDMCETEKSSKKENSTQTNDISIIHLLVKRLKTENAQLKTENAQLKTENAQLMTENAQLMTENAQLMTENAQLMTENAQLKTENPQLKTENAQLKTENVQLKTDVKTLSEYLIQLYETS